MPFDTFKQLHIEQKCMKLIQAYEKIIGRFLSMKHVLTCCRNYSTITVIFNNLLEMVSNVRSFVKFLVEENNKDFIIRPGCFNHQPSVRGLDFFASDLGALLETIRHSIANKSVHENDKYNVLFELVHSIYNLLKHFQTKYTSHIYNEM